MPPARASAAPFVPFRTALDWLVQFTRPLEQPEAIRQETARVLTRLLTAVAPLVALYGLITAVFNRADLASFTSGVLIACIAPLLWLASRLSRRGYTIAAFSFICLTMPTLLSLGAAIASGELGVRLLYYNALIILVAGWFLGPRPTLVFSAYILVLLLGAPLYMPKADAVLLLRTVVTFTVMVWIVTLLMGIYQRRLDQLRLRLEREHDLHYQRILEQIRDLVIITDLDGRIRSVNHPLYLLAGLVPDDLIGRDALDLVHPDDREAFSGLFQRLLSDPAVPIFEVRLRPPDDQPDAPPVWVAVTASLVRDERGQPASLIFTARDITRRREAEAALRISEERYRLISETMSDYVGTVIADRSRILRWEWVTDSLQRVTGFHPDEMQGVPPSFWYHPEDYPRVLADWERVRQGETVEGEYRVPVKTGGYKWLRIIRRPTFTPDGLVRVYIIGRDITEQKAAEARMLELVRERERLHTIHQFVRAVSHDFRTALAVIETNNYLLERIIRPHLDPDRRAKLDEHAHAIRDSVRHMVSQLDNMRAVATERSADAALIDLGALTRRIAADLRPRCEAKAVHLTCEIAQEAVWIRAGEDEIARAINHVLENALTHTPPAGMIALRADRMNDRAVVQIQDTGPGIPAEHLPFLFDPFYRVDAARTPGLGGVGFGLTLARLLTEIYDGALTVSSTVGTGSIFTLSFPLARPVDAPEAADSPSGDAPASSYR
nr:multi-sensor signal transduction histidine kinase [uncultured bacterium]